jgi:hypothetical protein
MLKAQNYPQITQITQIKLKAEGSKLKVIELNLGCQDAWKFASFRAFRHSRFPASNYELSADIASQPISFF